MTPQISPATSPIVEVSEDEEGAEDTDYVADLQAAQSTWDLWPTTAYETPTPAQDTPSLPHGEQTLAQNDWRQGFTFISAIYIQFLISNLV